MTPLIELKGITKRYRGHAAISDIDFSLRPGEVHAILGENGAGKSTLSKVIAGVIQPSDGQILRSGVPVSFASPAQARSAGIAMVFQETSLVPTMTVAQNLFLGEERGFMRVRGTQIAAQQFLQSLNFQVDPSLDVGVLGAAQRQMVEIARAVRAQARVILFDEPTAALTPEEKNHFYALVRRLSDQGVSIVLISHALEEALDLSDRITVLCDGRRVVTDDAQRFDRARIVSAMLRRDGQDEQKVDPRTKPLRLPKSKVLSVQNLSYAGLVNNCSFSAYAGQVTGLFGLVGAGRSETAQVIAGLTKRNRRNGGKILLDGRPVRYATPRRAVRDGVVYVTEDRKQNGFFETLSIGGNLQVNLAAAGLQAGAVVRPADLRALAEHWTKRLSIKGLDPDAQVIELSGGNQQKVVIARSLLQRPRLVIFDEPTKGVDVGAIPEIHGLIAQLADAGLAVLVISSYLPEVISVSDRILVFRRGRVVEEFGPSDSSPDDILFAAVH